MPRERPPMGDRPTKADVEKYLQDSTPEQLAVIRQRWSKADIDDDTSVCLALLLVTSAGLPEGENGMVYTNTNRFLPLPTIIRNIHIDAVSYIKECGCCGEKAEALRMCGSCRLVKYCGRQCQVRDWKDKHKLVCKGLQINGPGSPLDFTAFDWRVALKQKLESGASEEELCEKGILWALRGRTIEEVKWGIVDKDRQAIPSGVKVWLHGGKYAHEVVSVRGPKTVEQVMDLILRVIRRESPHKTYTEADMRLSRKCNDCPYNAFVGFQTLPPFEGMPAYKTLWSINMCRAGAPPQILRAPGPLRARDFVPEQAINRQDDI